MVGQPLFEFWGKVVEARGAFFEGRGVTFGDPGSFLFEARGVTFGGPWLFLLPRSLLWHPVRSKVRKSQAGDHLGIHFGSYGREFWDLFEVPCTLYFVLSYFWQNYTSFEN